MTGLAQAFTTYFDEIDRCLATKCYWSLLHLLVVIPAVCAALETPNGEAGGSEYKNWCRRYFDKDTRFTASDGYAIRVALVHQGRTTADEGQYRSYSFVWPPEQDVHLTVRELSPGQQNLTVDVEQLANETRRAMEVWFKDEQRGPQRQSRIPLLARQGEAAIPRATGVILTVPTISSTGVSARSVSLPSPSLPP
jgi:hypothetical protein